MAKPIKPPKPGGGGSNTVPQVTGLTANVSSSGVLLQWNIVPNASGYWVRRSDHTSAIAIIQDNKFTDGWVNPGTSYTYSIAAVVNNVLGPNSVSVTVNT